MNTAWIAVLILAVTTALMTTLFLRAHKENKIIKGSLATEHPSARQRSLRKNTSLRLNNALAPLHLTLNVTYGEGLVVVSSNKGKQKSLCCEVHIEMGTYPLWAYLYTPDGDRKTVTYERHDEANIVAIIEDCKQNMQQWVS
jgi:hypothetical protein